MQCFSNWRQYAALRDSVNDSHSSPLRPDVSAAFEAFMHSFISHEESLRGEFLEADTNKTQEDREGEEKEWKESKERAECIVHLLDLFLQYFSVCDDNSDDTDDTDDLLDVLSWCRASNDNDDEGDGAFMIESDSPLSSPLSPVSEGGVEGEMKSERLFANYDVNTCNSIMHFVFDELITTSSDGNDGNDGIISTNGDGNGGEIPRAGGASPLYMMDDSSSVSSVSRGRGATPTNIIPPSPPSPGREGASGTLSDTLGALSGASGGVRSRSISISRSSVSSSQSLRILSQMVEEKNHNHYRQVGTVAA